MNEFGGRNIINFKEACAVLGVSRNILTGDIRKGKFRGTYSKVGKYLKFNKRKLEDWIGTEVDDFADIEDFESDDATEEG